MGKAPNVALIGASGHAGVELTRLLPRHARVRVLLVSGDRWIGETSAQRAGATGTVGAQHYLELDEGAALADLAPHRP